MLDVVEDHFEVLLVEGGSRSSDSSCDRWRRVIVSPSHLAHLRCWNRCFRHQSQGWTCTLCELPSKGFPVRSSMGLGNWVGLEQPDWSVSPSDCWTSLPTGRCSTVEPDWSFPSVQLRSCFNEIFGGRGDKYCLSYNISPFSIFQLLKYNGLEVFLEEWSHSIVFDRTLILLWFQDQYRPQNTASWCLFHALCMYRARRGTEKSIYSGSLWLSFLDEQVRRVLSVFWSIFDPQVSIHCW